MKTKQPYQKDKAKGRWQRKLAAALLAVPMLWLPNYSAHAAITDTVVATGMNGATTLTSSATVNVAVVPANPQLSMVKTPTLHDGGDGSMDPGDTITYTFTLTNTGNVTLQTISLTDTLASLSGTLIAPLAPGAIDSTSFTATHTITAADILAGSYTNTATAQAHAVSGQNISATATVNTPLNLVSSMTLTKTGSLNMGSNGRADAGDTITYQFLVTNTGPTPLHNITIVDPLVYASLGNNDRMIAMIDGAKQEADPISVGATDPVASARQAAAKQCIATAPISTNLNPIIDTAQLDETGLNIDRQLVRMSGDSPTLAAGDKIGFLYDLNNTGNVPLTSIVVEQADALAFSNRLDLLAPNASDNSSVIFTRNVTEDEIKAGQINAPAMITARSHGHSTTQNLNDAIALSAIRTYDSIATATIPAPTWPLLNPGTSTTFTATYTLTQPDIDNSNVHNSATAKALNTANQTLLANSSFDQPIDDPAAVGAVKTGTIALGPDNAASVGDVITYHFAITNLGNTTLHNVTVTDTEANVVGTPIATLAPGVTDSARYTATHALVAADVTAGQFTNQATVTGRTLSNATVTALSDNTDPTLHNKTIVQWPAIHLVKTVAFVKDENNNGFTDAGDTIHYAFAITNTGKVALNNVLVTDTSLPGVVFNTTTPLASLAPGATDSSTFTSVYTITQANVNAGEVDNIAKVEATDANNVKVVSYSDPGVPTNGPLGTPTKSTIAPHPVVTLIKTQASIEDKNGNSLTDAGDVIHYTFKVKNTGNLPFTSLNITDLLPGAVMNGAALSNVAPGAEDATTFTATYTITATDMKLGSVSNQAKATGTTATGGTATDLSDNTDPNQNNPTVTPIIASPSIAVIKRIVSIIDTNNNGTTDVGDTINYAFDIKNTGNVPLTDVYVTDPLIATILPATHIANLPAGNEVKNAFTASYALTAIDITNGKVTNQATAFGTYNNAPVSDLSDNASYLANNSTVATLGSGIAVIKTFAGFTDVNNNGIVDKDDIVKFTFAVTNIGSGNISNVSITDANADIYGGGLPFGVLLNLAAGTTNSSFFTAEHKLTQADITAGGIYNQATVQGTSALTNSQVTDLSDPQSNFGDAPTYVAIPSQSGIALIKKLKNFTDANGNGVVDVGDTLNYEFDVYNTGNVDLANLELKDNNVTIGTLPTLAAGTHDFTTFTFAHPVTLADATAGFVSNQATIKADVITGGSVTDDSDPSSLTGNAPTITPVFVTTAVLTKVADKSEVKRGDVVTYTITAANLLPTTFELVDVMPPGFAYVAGSATINTITGPVAIIPVINGRNLDFPPKAPVAGKLILKLKLMASTTLSTGKFINNAQLINPSNGALLATAQATVSIIEDATFDCSDIIGRVFDDKNANGYMDDGELGLPGVRVVTLNGLLVTTDAEGRFHVPCAAIPDSAIGSNFLMKLDVRTLPTGYRLTTENPRDVRVTRGKVVKLNFGATINHEVRLDITGKAFNGDSLDLTDKWIGGTDQLLAVLAQQRSSLKIVYHQNGEDADLAAARVAAVQETIATAWKMGQGKYKLVIATSVGIGK